MNRNILLVLVLAATIFFGCTRDSSTIGSAPAPQSATAGSSNAGTAFNSHSAARMTASGYSQPISIDTANKMIGSYITGQGFPAADTSLRSMNFSADTLRAYLALHPEITTLKFMFAHQPEYANSNYGKDAHMNPKALTVVIVGVNSSNQFVKNSSGGVYEHMEPCPVYCDIETPYIY